MPEDLKSASLPLHRRHHPAAWPVFLVVLAILVWGIYWFAYRPDNGQSFRQFVLGKTGETTIGTSKLVGTSTKEIVDEGIQWQTPVQVGDLGLYTGPAANQKVSYYKVGTRSGHDLVLTVLADGVGSADSQLLRQADGGKWVLYARHSTSLTGLNLDYRQIISSDAVIPSLDVPNLIPSGSFTFVNVGVPLTGPLFSDVPTTDMKQIAATAFGPIQAVPVVDTSIKPLPTGLKTVAYYLQRHDGRTVQVKLDIPFINDDGSLAAAWTGGATVTEQFVDAGLGCMGTAANLVVVDGELLAGKTVVAKTTTGESLYAFPDAGAALTKALYALYGARSKPASFATYAASYPYLLWQNGLGQWTVLQNNALPATPMCGLK